MNIEGGDMPILQSMLERLLKKDIEVRVIDTHPVWCGKILKVTNSVASPGLIDVTVLNDAALEHGVERKHSFTIRQPERWKLGKNEEGRWTLWPPRAESRPDRKKK